MAATDEMLAIALRHVPHACCLVPEKREERTTEGGLDVVRGENHLRHVVEPLKAAGIRVSLFIEPEPARSRPRRGSAREIVELHTGAYCERALEDDAAGLARELDTAASARRTAAAAAGLEVHAGTASPSTRSPPSRASRRSSSSTSAISSSARRSSAAWRRPSRRMRALMDEARAARRRPAGQGAMILGLGNDIIDIRRIEKTLERYGERFLGACLHSHGAREIGRAASAAPPPTPSASPPRRPAQRRWAPGFRKGVFWRDMGVVNLRSGRPTMVLTGGAAEQLRRITPAGLRGPRRSLPDRRFPAGPGHRRHLRRAGRQRLPAT